MHAGSQRPGSRSSDEVFETLFAHAKRFLQRHGRRVLMVTAAALVVLLAYRGYRNKAGKEQVESWKELATLTAVQDVFLEPEEANRLLMEVIRGCEAILDRHWKSDATPWVLLRLANAQRLAGFHKHALETYRRLEKEHPSHYATSFAALNLAGVLEDMGRFEEAARAYEALARQGGENSVFWVDAGRSWEMAGNRDAAVRAYQGVADKEGFALAAYRLESLTAGKPLLTPPSPALEPEESQPPEPVTPAEEPTGNDRKDLRIPPEAG